MGGTPLTRYTLTHVEGEKEEEEGELSTKSLSFKKASIRVTGSPRTKIDH